MPFQPIPGFCAGSYNSRARGASARRTVNMRIEKNEGAAPKSPYTAFPRSGKRLFAELPNAPVTGCWANKTRVFVVSGGDVFELFEGATGAISTGANSSATLIGSVAIGSNPSIIRANGSQLMVVSGGNAYVATGTSLYQPIVSYASGTVDVAGTTVTWISGDKFTDVSPGEYFMLDETLYTVASVTDNEHLELTAAVPGPVTGIAFQIGSELLMAASVEFIDGYFIVGVPNSKKFRISALLPDGGGRKWDSLDVAEKSGSTDNIAMVQNLGGQLALIGDTNSTEIWGDSGANDFPFVRIGGRNMNCGAEAAYSVAKLDDGSLCWLKVSDGGGGQVVRSVGGEPVRVSDHAMENAIRGYGIIYDAIGSAYVENGHSFYRIDFPSANRTWELDITTGVWCELGISTVDDEVYAADLGRYHCYVTWPSGARMHLAFDYTSGKVWEVSPDFTDDDGTEIPVMMIAPHIGTNFERIACAGFALDCELGTIDPALLGADGKPLIPTVNLSHSDDGGRTWHEDGAASLGRSGEYEGTYLAPDELFDATASSQTNPQVFESVPIWRALGDFWIAKTFKIKSTAKMLRAVHNAYVDLGNRA